MRPKRTTFNSQNWVVDADQLGRQSRSARRHEVDKHEAMRLYKLGMSDLNIAVRLGVSKGDVYRWRKINGLISNMIRRPEPPTPSSKTEQK